MRKLLSIVLIGIYLLLSSMKLANAQAFIPIFVAEQMASGALNYFGSRGAASLMGEDKDQSITHNQLADIVGQIVNEQTKQLEATMREIDKESRLFAYRKDLENGLNSMQSLLRNYNTGASDDTRMERIRSILNYAATVEGAFDTFFKSETLNKHYPELFFTYYATYSRFAEIFIVIKSEEQVVNNLMVSDGIKGFKEVDNYEVAKAALDKLEMIHKIWHSGYQGHSFWNNRFGPKYIQDYQFSEINTCNTRCLYIDTPLSKNGKPLPEMTLATSWGPNPPGEQPMNPSLARTMDVRGQARHFSVQPYKGKVCSNQFAFFAMRYPHPTYGGGRLCKEPPSFAIGNKSYLSKTLRLNDMRKGDFNGPKVDQKIYSLHPYYQEADNKGIVTSKYFKYFLEPHEPVKMVKMDKVIPRWQRGPWAELDDWQFRLGNLPNHTVYQFFNETSSEKIRDCQILAAFGLYDKYLQHLTGVDFNNIAFVRNLKDLVVSYNDGKTDMAKDAHDFYSLFANKYGVDACRQGMVSKFKTWGPVEDDK